MTSDLLKKNWITFHEENKSNLHAKYLQHCHSQGAIHVKNALEELPKEIQDRVIVIAIAPARVVSKKLCYQSYNYASKSDIVSRAEVLFAFGENLNELILLDPHPDARGFDHNYQSPTYFSAIAHHIKEYIENNGSYYG